MGDPADMKVTYKSIRYQPELIAGTYVRLARVPSWETAKRPYLVAECLALPANSKTKAGHGGADIPESVKIKVKAQGGPYFVEWDRAS